MRFCSLRAEIVIVIIRLLLQLRVNVDVDIGISCVVITMALASALSGRFFYKGGEIITSCGKIVAGN